jgi:hypothetical protein
MPARGPMWCDAHIHMVTDPQVVLLGHAAASSSQVQLAATQPISLDSFSSCWSSSSVVILVRPPQESGGTW